MAMREPSDSTVALFFSFFFFPSRRLFFNTPA